MYLKVKLLCVAALIAAFAFPYSSYAHAQCLNPKDMNGVWQANDGGTYYVRQVGNSIWWFGMSPDGGKRWTNVYYGVRNGSTVTGTWADVPMGRSHQAGTLTLKVELTWNNGISGFTRTQVSGGFYGSRWYHTCDDNQTTPVDDD